MVELWWIPRIWEMTVQKSSRHPVLLHFPCGTQDEKNGSVMTVMTLPKINVLYSSKIPLYRAGCPVTWAQFLSPYSKCHHSEGRLVKPASSMML